MFRNDIGDAGSKNSTRFLCLCIDDMSNCRLISIVKILPNLFFPVWNNICVNLIMGGSKFFNFLVNDYFRIIQLLLGRVLYWVEILKLLMSPFLPHITFSPILSIDTSKSNEGFLFELQKLLSTNLKTELECVTVISIFM